MYFAEFVMVVLKKAFAIEALLIINTNSCKAVMILYAVMGS